MTWLPIIPLYRTPDGLLHESWHGACQHVGKVTATPQRTLTRRIGEGSDEDYAAMGAELEAGTWARETLVAEVVAVPDYEALKPFDGNYPCLSSGPGDGQDGLGVLAEIAVANLEVAIVQAVGFDPAVMLLSSGYDSRLVLALLKHLGIPCPICITFEPEVEAAGAIVQHIYGDDARWLALGAAGLRDYYAPCLGWDRAGELSESARFWGGARLAEIMLDRVLDEKPQVISSLWSDELGKWNRRQSRFPLSGWLAAYMFDEPGVLPCHPGLEHVFPFASSGYVSLLQQYAIPCNLDEWKKAMIRVIDPDLAELPNYRHSMRKLRDDFAARQLPGWVYNASPTQEISAGTAYAMAQAYKRSWYAREGVGPRALGMQDIRVIPYYSEAVSHYLNAAIYDKLIEEGVDVRA